MTETGQHVVERAAGRVPVVATGTFGGSLQEQANFIVEMYKVAAFSLFPSLRNADWRAGRCGGGQSVVQARRGTC